MSDAGEPQAGARAEAGEPTEDEIRAAYEAELSRITTTDMMAQATVSLLNLGARRLAPAGPDDVPGSPAPGAGQRDLEQARDAIDGARALLEILERRIPQELGPLRDALSRLQMTYAREAPQSPSTPSAEQPGDAGAAPQPAGAGGASDDQQQPSGPGPAESSGRLWVPGR